MVFCISIFHHRFKASAQALRLMVLRMLRTFSANEATTKLNAKSENVVCLFLI